MTRWHTNRRWLATLFLPLLAASLACSALTGGSAPGGAALTQAAATINAAATQAATALGAAPTTAANPTQAPTEASAPTAAASATAAATAAATEAATAAVTEAATSEATAGGAVVLDPCSLMTAAQAQSLTGVPMGAPTSQSGGCVFTDAATGHSAGAVIYALPASQAPFFFSQFVPSFKSSGLAIDPAVAAKLDADSAAGDMVAAVDDLVTMSVGQPKFNAKKVEGLGSSAVWTWNTVLGTQDGLLVAAKPGVVVAMAVIVGAAVKEADAQSAMQTRLSAVLDGLPENFTVAGLQVPGADTVLDPCTLATASDIDPIMDTQSEDGVVNNGSCLFQDVATHQVTVRVFALPAGVSAANALNLAALTMLVGNTTGQSKVSTDVAAGDLVGAVKDLGGAVTSGSNYFIELTPDLADGGFLFIQTLDTKRISYFLAARPGALVGIEGVLGPGDDVATSKLARAILERILAKLPDKFTVNGVP